MAADITRKVNIFFRDWGPIVLLCLATGICYANSLQNGFVADDYYIIQLDRQTLSFKAALNSLTGADRLFENDDYPYYRPLTRFSFLVDKYFFGTNPAGFHAVSVALHVLCTVFVYLTLLRLGHRRSVSLCAALLFGIHPINAEAVNFISSRNNILATIFVLASLLAFLHAEKSGGKAGYFLSAVFFFFAMMSKETGAMLFPFLIILKTYHLLKKRGAQNLLQWDMTYILYHVIFLTAYLSLRYIAIDGNYLLSHMPGLGDRLKQLLYIIPSYFSLLVFPEKITWPHYVPKHFGDLIFPLALWWSVLAIAIVSIALQRNKNTKFWFAWLLINFIPVSGLVPFSSLLMAERYLYLPFIGMFVLAAEVMFSVAARFDIKKLHLVAFACLVLIFGIRTSYRNVDWRDDLSLMRSAVKSDPASARNRFFLGLELYLDGRTHESRSEFEQALTLDASFDCASWAFYYLGAMHVETGSYGEGERCFIRSVQAGNSAAQYILSLYYSGTKNAGNDRGKRETFIPVTLNAVPFLPEVNEKMSRKDTGRRNNREHIHDKHQPISSDDTSQSAQWIYFHRYSSGTELYYDPATVRKKGNDVIFVTRQRIAPSDKLAFTLRIIKVPLARAVETRFVFNINCPQKVYTTNSMEFRDHDGNVLGQIYPEKEEYILKEYLMPGTPMRSLSDTICREQFP